MSRAIHLFKKTVKEQHRNYSKDNFFENEDNIDGFSSDEMQGLIDRLLRYSFVIENENQLGISFGFKNDETVSALLTKKGLYFSASGEEGIFEINMTASEFTDTNEFLKYDPQEGTWEEPM